MADVMTVDEINEMKNLLEQYTESNMWLEKENTALRADLTRMRQEVDQKVIDDIEKATFVFDFTAMRVFSLERLGWDKQAYSVIGYIKDDGEIAEWKFYCTHEQHEKLAEEFRSLCDKRANIKNLKDAWV